MSESKVLLFDIESTHLDADFGTMLCVGWKWLGDKNVNLISLLDRPAKFAADPTDDKWAIREFMKIYESAQIAVTYNGILFDRPYLIAKTLEYNLPLPPSIPMVDLYFTVKSNMRISRKNLWTVQKHLGLKNSKTGVDGKIWKKAQIGNVVAMRWIERHCKDDVLVLEEAYERLRPLVRTHPRVAGGDLGKCRFCASDRLQRRGLQVTKTKGENQRVQCRDCGGWDTRTLREAKKLK